MLLTAIDSHRRWMVAMKFAQVVKYRKLFEASQYFPTLRNVEKKAGDEDWRSHSCFGAPEREQNITVWNVKISI